ncbi:hypothetical protein Hanom_Chr12g01141021 [Helianthus anomalus]
MEHPSSSQATEAATDAVVQGEFGSGAGGDRVDGVEVDFEELRDLVYKDSPVEVDTNPEQVPEEVRRVLWLTTPPPNLT